MAARMLLIIGAFAAALWGINYFYNSGYFNISEIHIEGSTHYGDEYIKELLHDLNGKNIFEADKKDTEDRLVQSLVWAHTVEFKKIFPDRIEISIIERKPSLLIDYRGGYFLIDEEGVVLEDLGRSIPDSYSSLLRIRDAIDHSLETGDTVAKKNVLSCADVYKGFDEDIRGIIKEAGIEHNIYGDIYFNTRDGMKIIFGDSSQVIKKIEVLKLLLKEGTVYNIIDLRSPDNPVVKY